jgi:hypothetical protein
VTTTREDFGTTLAMAARLYANAENRGDIARAAAYAVAVEALVNAWPSDEEPERVSGSVGGRESDWPVYEQTLMGLGAVAGAAGGNHKSIGDWQ